MIQNLPSKTVVAKFVFTILFCEAHLIFFSYFSRFKHDSSEGSDDLWTHASVKVSRGSNGFFAESDGYRKTKEKFLLNWILFIYL